MSESLNFAETTLQEVALIFMAIVYTTRVIWFTRYKAAKERQRATGAADTTKKKGIIYSIMNIAMPWAMESSRNNFLVYVQFVIFHLGVTFAILLSFLIPYAPGVLEIAGISMIFQIMRQYL